MAISASQLNTWSGQGAITTSSRAYASVRAALTVSSSPLAARQSDIFLQGSYANHTNIYSDSDVDIVVLYDGTFYKDMTALSPEEQRRHEQTFSPATYHWRDLHGDVLATLRAHFGQSAVTPGNKAIKVQTGHGGMTADVVPAVAFRRYASFVDASKYRGHFGVQFFDSAGNAIINYPQYHIDRGEEKNRPERTRGNYKATIRLLKNLRNYLVDTGLLADGRAPSYFIEGALYNVPDNLFVGQFIDTVPAILDYLYRTPYAGFLSQNGVVPLIGMSATQWSEDNYAAFITAAVQAVS